MPGESREDRISWQDQRLAAVRRKRENMVESVVANATLGGLLGTFVGYMAGSAVGVATWNCTLAPLGMQCECKFMHVLFM